MKRFIQLILLVFLLSGCNEYRKIDIESVKFKDIHFHSTSSATVLFVADVDNPTRHTLSLQDMELVLLKEGKRFVQFELVGTPTAAPKKMSEVPIRINARVVDPIALISTGLNFRSWSMGEFMLDGSVVLRKNHSAKRRIRIKNQPLKSIIGVIK